MKEQIPGMRILLVVPFTKPDYSGSGINAFNFARFLNNNGQKASILTFNRNLRLKRKEILDQVPIHRISYFNRNLLLKLLSLFMILPVYLFSIIRSDTIIIYGAHIIGYQLIISLSRIFNKTVIFRSLLLGADDLDTLLDGKTGLSSKITLSLFKKIDYYFAINPVFAESFEKHTGQSRKIILTPQGVDSSQFVPASPDQVSILRQKLGIQEHDFVILSVGFLLNRKGFSKAFEVLRDLPFDFKYIIAGEYDFGRNHFMYPLAKQAIDIRNSGIEILGDKLMFAGPVENVRDYYQSSDLVLINSVTEGLPNILLEAMACGRTVLAKDIPGIRYLIDHLQTGIVFGNNEEMYEWITRLYNEPDLRKTLGENAMKFIQSQASFEQTWEKISRQLSS